MMNLTALLTRSVRRTLVATILALLAAGILGADLRAAEKRPNFVIFLADDLGYGDVSWHGSVYKMPNLDQLAQTGIRLESHYVFPMCSPTRAAILSGRYASRFGCTAAQNERVYRFGQVTLPSALKEAGYDTCLVGKWHLGSKLEWGPNLFGFDHSYGHLAGGVTPYGHRYKEGPYTYTWHRDDKLVEEQGHVTDLFAREAVQFIQSRTEKPFFLYFAFSAVHIPIDEPQQWLDANAGIADAAKRLHAACATHMDDAVGQVLTALDRKKLRENTLVVFLSDNGAHRLTRNDDPKYPGTHPHLQIGGSNAPWRGWKTELYEGGVRTPGIVSWPGRLKPGRIDLPLHVTDWMPTLTGLAGWKPRADLRWDGQDIWPIITGQQSSPGPRTMYWLGVGRRSSAVRHGDWKLISFQDGKKELYDLAADPGETKNLAAQEPQRVAALEKLMAQEAARDNDAAVAEELKASQPEAAASAKAKGKKAKKEKRSAGDE
jgi:arylsulfatase A-like enzyme